MKAVTKLAGDVAIEDIIVHGTEKTVIGRHPHGSHTMRLIFHNETWKDYNVNTQLEVSTPEWYDLTESTVSEISMIFQPGLQIDREIIEPLWTQATLMIADQRENYLQAMLEDGGHPADFSVDSYDKETARNAAIDRVIGALEMVFYGQTNKEAL